ncbi:unnamed protein product [Clonostachys rosea]|uniref:F-box domain-containing protein n=1 Tax=Bionectria ochroleuca TaxID=29856 RepID=A0ABY6UWK0_BIOOC|nr:unnamed protein product [Clonostachys rosea]
MDFTPNLSTLAPEILQPIIEHTHASAHWPLAQTCKYIYLNSLPILDRHRKAYQEYRITSDLDPWTVSKLLWSIFSDGVASIEAWHVREFEVWVEGEDSQSCVVNADTGKRILQEDVRPRSLSSHDIEYFCSKMLKLPRFYGEDRDLNQEVRRSLEAGRGSFVKALVLAHLPRIRALRYAQFEDECTHYCLRTLCGFIYWCKSAGTWLPGLASLERVAVAIGLDRAGVEVDPPGYLNRNADEFCALLCLPNLDEIYFSHLDGKLPLRERGYLWPQDIQPSLVKTSPVRTIILDMLEYDLSDKLIDFIGSTPRRLENLAIRFDDNNYIEEDSPESAERLIHKLAKHQGLSLQRLCIHNDRQDDTPADMNWRTLGQLQSFGDLRVANVSWKAIEASLDTTKDVPSRSELLDRLFEVFRRGLPATMEVITFSQFESDEPIFLQAKKTTESDLDYLDDAVEVMITSRHYQNLKAIFLQDIQNQVSHLFGCSLRFPKTMKAADSQGIHVYTTGSKPLPGLSTNGEFVPFPRRDCMVTGQFETETRERLYCTKRRDF